MITSKYRPQKFDEVVGQDLVKKVLKSIIKNPYEAPKSIILQGPFGCGKTTLARIFARALNCKEDGIEPCLECSICKNDIQMSAFYREYDVAMVGNVEDMRDLRGTFHYSLSKGWKVIVFDEAHLASKKSQSALLKEIEESPDKVFFIFCSTDVEKILNTVRSRSLELRFELLSSEEIAKNINEIAEQKDKNISEEIVDLISLRSKGHMRNAHMMLDRFFMIGEKDFKDSIKSSENLFIKYFYNITIQNNQKIFNIVDKLMTFPLADLRTDFQNVVLRLTEVLVGYREGDEIEKKIVKNLKGKIFKIIKQSDWILSNFNSDLSFKACMLSLYQLLGGSGGESNKKSRYEKAKKR
ncbi:MAG: ATP-binding protein [Atribacterota bacterium]